MKKICLILIMFSMLSITPAFAMKIILNHDTDRTVPSRSSSPVEEFIQDNNYQYDNSRNNKIINVNYKRQSDAFEKYYKPILGQDFRLELLGTRWNYPVYNEPNPAEVQQVYNQNYEAPALDAKLGRYHREAVDYYTLDTIKNPRVTIPTGYID